MKFLTLLILFPCLLFAQLMPKYFSNTHNFTSTYSSINNKFNKTSTDKAIDDFQGTDKELDKNETEQSPSDSIVKVKYEKKAYVDSSKIIYSRIKGPPFVYEYCMGHEDYDKNEYPMGSGEILNILEKDIKERNMPNRFYKTARIHNYIEGSILISSISSFLVGAILLKNDVKGGKYPLWVGMITFTLNGFVYGLIWRSIYLEDAIKEYNKNLAY